VADLQDFIGPVSGVTLISEPEDLREASLLRIARLDDNESPLLHKKLKGALATAMWNSNGGGSINVVTRFNILLPTS
jgi:hypothetical protein